MPPLPKGSLNAPQTFIGLLRIHLPDWAVSVIGFKQDQSIAALVMMCSLDIVKFQICSSTCKCTVDLGYIEMMDNVYLLGPFSPRQLHPPQQAGR